MWKIFPFSSFSSSASHTAKKQCQATDAFIGLLSLSPLLHYHHQIMQCVLIEVKFAKYSQRMMFCMQCATSVWTMKRYHSRLCSVCWINTSHVMCQWRNKKRGEVGVRESSSNKNISKSHSPALSRIIDSTLGNLCGSNVQGTIEGGMNSSASVWSEPRYEAHINDGEMDVKNRDFRFGIIAIGRLLHRVW